MGTGSGYYDAQMMERTQCPHCFHRVRFERTKDTYSKQRAEISVEIGEREPFVDRILPVRTLTVLECPNCRDVIVWMRWSTCEADRVFERIYPVRSSHQPAPKDSPAHIARAYEDACRVFPISPNAAAALARRALQLTLRETVGGHVPTLEREIEAIRDRLPVWLVEGLHALREMGNFALHPSEDAFTGEIMETTEEEADLTITLVSALLTHLYIGRQASADLSAAVKAKRRKWRARNQRGASEEHET
jgi:hypothetical protein